LKIHRVWVVVSPLVTFTFGIPGLLLYIVIRGFLRRTFTMQEA